MKTRTAPWDYERPVGPLPQPDKACPRCGKPAFVYCIPDDKRLVFCETCGEYRIDQDEIYLLALDALVKETIRAEDPQGEPAEEELCANCGDTLGWHPSELCGEFVPLQEEGETGFQTRASLGL